MRHDVTIDSSFVSDEDCKVSCSCGWSVEGLTDLAATEAAVEHQRGTRINDYLVVIEGEREMRPAEAMLLDEIEALRSVVRLAHETLTLQFQAITWNRFSPVEIEVVDRALNPAIGDR